MFEVVPDKHVYWAFKPDGKCKGGNPIMNSANRNVGHRSFGTLMKSFVAIGATSALMLAGLAFVAVSPASAAGAPNKLVFTGEPSSTATAGSSAGLSTVAVSVEDASNAVDT